ncbi:MAG: type II toxin-antitoxin system VapC family toxin [Moorea sp. SIO1F2]|uniref:type II toxin-antitoxin system VapC family toxin n=1 Tax=Moorena sp. SIO1F2 TaxID=2607819 RepID=UPI0013B8973E|nr:type II toxin-antitoxin system VapC family toxin [Moorena sp. SIO1F2]NET85203.1 type II toxin-antitoxin system VapC family toxin [Moorena sp. SIO1F2]
MIILDTNVISELMKGNNCSFSVSNWTSQQLITNLYTTTITQAEILYGIAILPQGKRQYELQKAANLMFTEDFSGRILSFDQKAAVSFALIASERRKIGQPISQADAQIAAICLIHNATLATRNVDDFKNCNIAITNPWDYRVISGPEN